MTRNEFHETIIPAAPGWSVIFIDVNSDPATDPATDDDPRMTDPVIAWAIASVTRPLMPNEDTRVAFTVPITASGPAGSQPHVLLRPDGQYGIPEHATFPTLAEAAAHLRSAAA